MCALLGGATAVPVLEAVGRGPGNAMESRKLGESSRVRESHSVSEKGVGLSIVESSPIPRLGGGQRSVA